MCSYKGFKLPWDLPLLVNVLLLLLYYTALLRFSPTSQVINKIHESNPCPKEKAELDRNNEMLLDKTYRAATFFLKRLWRSNRPCLRRTLILYRWCCRRGIPSRVVIGVKKTEGMLQSHAWLEIAHVPFKEKPEQLKEYTPILGG